MSYSATWKFCSYSALKSIQDSKLREMFKLPKFKLVLVDNELNRSLNLSKYTVVKYSDDYPMLMMFHIDLNSDDQSKEHVDNVCLWHRYTHAKQGSAVNYGASFKYEPQCAAQQIAFWLPLERWFHFEQSYNKFRKCLTIGITIEEDNIPLKVKRIWFKKFIEALNQYVEKGNE